MARPLGKGAGGRHPPVRAFSSHSSSFPAVQQTIPSTRWNQCTRHLNLRCGLTPNPRIYLNHRIAFIFGLKISTKLWKHQNLTRNQLKKCCFIPQIPKSVANFEAFWLKLFLCNSHSFINLAIQKYSSVLDPFQSLFGTIYRASNLWFVGETIPVLHSMGLPQYTEVSKRFLGRTGLDLM